MISRDLREMKGSCKDIFGGEFRKRQKRFNTIFGISYRFIDIPDKLNQKENFS